MFEETLPVKQIILSPLIPYFQWKLTVNWAGSLWPRRSSSSPAKSISKRKYVRGENLKLVSVPVTRNSETEGNPSLNRPGSSSEEAGHLHNCTPKIRMEAKPNFSHNTSIILWVQPYPCHPQNIELPFYHQHFPRWKGQIQPHHSQHSYWWLFKRPCAAQSTQHVNLKVNYTGDIFWKGNLNSSINSYTKCTPAPQIPINELWDHHSWKSLSTAQEYIMFLKEPHG